MGILSDFCSTYGWGTAPIPHPNVSYASGIFENISSGKRLREWRKWTFRWIGVFNPFKISRHIIQTVTARYLRKTGRALGVLFCHNARKCVFEICAKRLGVCPPGRQTKLPETPKISFMSLRFGFFSKYLTTYSTDQLISWHICFPPRVKFVHAAFGRKSETGRNFCGISLKI